MCLSARNRKNQLKLKMAFVQPKSAQSGCTGELAALGKKLTSYDYNSPDCPVCIGLSGEPTVGRAIRARHVAEPTVGRGHRTIRCAPDSVRCANGSKAPTVGFTKEGKNVRCARRQKARIAFLECTQRILAALGL
jgi:hypothetical protein